MRRTKLVLGLLGSWLLYACAPSEDFDIDSPIFDKYALSLQEQRFTFSPEGKLVKGPVRAPNQPIDYSSLIKEAYLRRGFLESITGCYPGIDHCGSEARRFRTKKVSINTILDPSSSEVNNSEVHSVAQSTIGKLGFDTTLAQRGQSADITVIYGSEKFILDQAELRADSLVKENMDYWKVKYDKQPFFYRLIFNAVKEPFCYVSGKNWINNEKIEIYVGHEGIDECLPQSYFSAIGFYELIFGIPSLADWSLAYTSPTFADHLFVDLLYSSDFPIDGGVDEMENFWSENAVRLWNIQIKREFDDRQ